MTDTRTTDRPKARKRPLRKITPAMRRRIEEAVDRLIETLDTLDPDADDEPNLGQLDRGQIDEGEPDADAEEDDPGEVDDEPEPSLGSFDRLSNQEASWRSRGDANFYVDYEADTADREPSLGSVAGGTQERWAIGDRTDREDDAGDNCERDPAELGIADADGVAEQHGFDWRGVVE